ncbi:MAG: DNA-directed RNA polymerase [Candidatus Nanohaloarchaeota archaeon QJJ-5]|nr:DNA-directed RNA polymerase [Candidatus Nanohaloarchaeota archaeon QJJ-5]
MYRELTIEERIRVDPELLGRDLQESVHQSLARQLEGTIHKDLGVVLAITDVTNIGEGDIEPEDAGVHYPVTYETLSFEPELHEVVEGEVVDVTDFGAFIRIGPIDGLCHISQIMNQYVDYDETQEMLVGEEGSKTLQQGDTVRARITAVSLDDSADNKVNLTMRQPALGKLEWIEEELEDDEEEEDE